MNCFRCSCCFLHPFPKNGPYPFLKNRIALFDVVVKNSSSSGKLCVRPGFRIARVHVSIGCLASTNISAAVTGKEDSTLAATESYSLKVDDNVRPEVLIDAAVSGTNIDKILKSNEYIAEQVYQSCKKYEGYLQSLYGSFDITARRFMASVIAIASFLGGRWLSMKRIPKYANLVGILSSLSVSISLYLVSRSAKQGCAAQVTLFLKEKGVLSVTEVEVRKIFERYGLTREEFLPYAKEIYKFYLMGCIQNSSLKLTEIAQLFHLKQIFHLTGQDVGDIHQEVGKELYRRTLVYLDESTNIERIGPKGNSPRNILRKKELKKKEKLKDLEYQEETKSLVAILDKYFCISDRVFNDNESEEAYMYEWSRLRKQFSLNEEEIEKRLNRIRIPLYETLAKAVIINYQIDSSILETASSTLSIEKEVSSQIHMQVYRSMLESILQNNERIPEQGLKEIQRVRQVFSIDMDTSQKLLLAVTIPAFQRKLEQTLHSCVADWISKDKDAFVSTEIGIDLKPYIQSLRAKTEELLLSSKEDLLLGFQNGIAGATASCFKKAMNFLRVQNIRGVEQEARVLIVFYKVAVEIIDRMKICDSTHTASDLVQKAMAKISSAHQTDECRLFYRIFLNDCLKELPLGTNKKNSLQILRRILSLSELDADEAYRNVIEPIYQRKLQNLVESQTNYTQEDKEKLRKLEETLSLSPDSSKQVKLQCYKMRLSKLVENNRIYSAKEADELDNLRNFLSITKDEVIPIHVELARPVFEQSIKEAMGSTGIIPAEYHDALDRLGERLGLPEREANAILYNITKGPMKAYVDRAIKIFQQRSAPRGANETRDIGDDPLIQKPGTSLGIEAGGNVAMELSNLVEYCVRNRLIVQRTILVDKEDSDDVTSEPEKRTYLEFPVTLRDLFDPSVLQEMYRQYLIQCFAVKSRSEKQRYFRDLDRLAGVFGLTSEEVNKVHSNLGTVIYNQYLSQALSEGRLEQKDLDFLNNIQQSLSMSPELCRGLIRDAKRSKVSSLLQTILSASKVSPSQMKELREVCHHLEVSLVDNTLSTKDQRKRLFILEVDACIENGLITVEDQSLIRELQHEYAISDEDAKTLIVECIQNRCNSHLIQAAAYLRQSKSEQAIEELNNLIKFGIFLPDKIPSSVVTIKEREELLLLYQASRVGETQGGSQERMELLRALFGFSKT
ncbi:chloroplast inner membrane protein Tic11 [Galdieria sulphuraria]|uniref:Chloroplast inner membrane protein Tic11 n=1 Tax=Galdieria sulphuraria TaxID=130081 RepID=M2XRJ4_GALSU|nr:chloroplast inner membrane protein Tic11 [Galdieria sulphuraria]EME32847.1 chloroplast inner membrane protein Tic11 [Galdieria sulphuraria]|eukprot:XP_005709367.1 chloroplast inner membrane protein Tic11 [Galdieria sulphuraria]